MQFRNIKNYYPFYVFFNTFSTENIINDIKKHGYTPSDMVLSLQENADKINNTQSVTTELYYGLCGLFYRFIYFFSFKNIRSVFKRMYHRIRYGVSDKDTWDLYYHIAAYSLPRIKRLRALTIAYPIDMTFDEWIGVLKEIEWAFEFILYKYNTETAEEEWDRCKKGIDLFSKHYFSLGW